MVQGMIRRRRLGATTLLQRQAATAVDVVGVDLVTCPHERMVGDEAE